MLNTNQADLPAVRGEREKHMQTLTQQELIWLQGLVKKSEANAKSFAAIPTQVYRSLWQLEYENMTALRTKLDAIIHSNDKRIAIKD